MRPFRWLFPMYAVALAVASLPASRADEALKGQIDAYRIEVWWLRFFFPFVSLRQHPDDLAVGQSFIEQPDRGGPPDRSQCPPSRSRRESCPVGPSRAGR